MAELLRTKRTRLKKMSPFPFHTLPESSSWETTVIPNKCQHTRSTYMHEVSDLCLFVGFLLIPQCPSDQTGESWTEWTSRWLQKWSDQQDEKAAINSSKSNWI